MKKLKRFCAVLFLITAFGSGLAACGTAAEKPEEAPEAARFVVETAFEYHFEKNGFYCDVVMPRVADSVPNGDAMNEQLSEYNTLQELQDSEEWGNWSSPDSYKVFYTVSNKDGICSLNMIHQGLKENGNSTDPGDYEVSTVNSYYYNEKTGKPMSQGEYLAALGYTEDDILELFNDKYGEKYSNRTYDFSHMIFWLDEANILQFSTYYIDQMDSNTADFALIINGEKYETGAIAPKASPFGEAVKSEEKFYDEIWAGSWWIEEYYDGAYVLYSLNREKGEKYPFHVEITKSNAKADFSASTYRGAALGDTKEQILALYPEIDPEEQKLLTDTEDLFSLWGDSYLYLEFHFEDDRVAKIAAGTLID